MLKTENWVSTDNFFLQLNISFGKSKFNSFYSKENQYLQKDFQTSGDLFDKKSQPPLKNLSRHLGLIQLNKATQLVDPKPSYWKTENFEEDWYTEDDVDDHWSLLLLGSKSTRAQVL